MSNLKEDKEEFNELAEEVDSEIPDFEAKQARYEVWMTGYDKNTMLTDFERLWASFDNADDAVEYAKSLTTDSLLEDVPEEVAFVVVEVETVVFDEDDQMYTNVGSIYRAEYTAERIK